MLFFIFPFSCFFPAVRIHRMERSLWRQLRCSFPQSQEEGSKQYGDLPLARGRGFYTWFLLSTSCCLFAGQQEAENFNCSRNTCVFSYFSFLYPLLFSPFACLHVTKRRKKSQKSRLTWPKYSRKYCEIKDTENKFPLHMFISLKNV